MNNYIKINDKNIVKEKNTVKPKSFIVNIRDIVKLNHPFILFLNKTLAKQTKNPVVAFKEILTTDKKENNRLYLKKSGTNLGTLSKEQIKDSIELYFDLNRVNLDYLIHYTENYTYKNYIKQISTIYTNINDNLMSIINIILPTLENQIKYVNDCIALEQQIETFNNKINILTKQKNRLLF